MPQFCIRAIVCPFLSGKSVIGLNLWQRGHFWRPEAIIEEVKILVMVLMDYIPSEAVSIVQVVNLDIVYSSQTRTNLSSISFIHNHSGLRQITPYGTMTWTVKQYIQEALELFR